MMGRSFKKIIAVFMTVLTVLSVCDTGVYALEEISSGEVLYDEALMTDGSPGFVSDDPMAEEPDTFAISDLSDPDSDTQDDSVSDNDLLKPAVSANDLLEPAVSANEICEDEFPEPDERFFGHIENDFIVDMPKDGSLVCAEEASGSDDTEPSEGGIGDDADDAASTIPARYTLDDNKYVSSVKDQGAWGTCWSFMAMASAESAYMRQNPGSEKNLSETQLIKYFYNGYYNEDIDRYLGDGTLRKDRVSPGENIKPVMMGGNADFTTFALARWTGPADEAYDPSLSYPSRVRTESLTDISVARDLAYNGDAEHLQNAYWISIRNRQDIKKAIMQYGAVGASYYDNDAYGSDYYKKKIAPKYSGPAVYYNYDKELSNHEVVIVGWDDNFDRNRFKYTYNNVLNSQKGHTPILPASNGAWLIKNSRGTDYGDKGFVWVSYEDTSLNGQGKRAYVFDFEPADNYAHNYQYDGSCYTASNVYPYAAAIYKASGRQHVEAVGVGFASANNEYTVSVYTHLTDPSNPESGRRESVQRGSTTYPGFYTILLDDFADIDKDVLFSVVIRSRTKDGGFTSFFVDKSYNHAAGYRFSADQTNDMTFFRTDNTKWLSSPSRDLNTIRIKAYTNDRGAEKKKPDNFSVYLPNLTYNGGDRTKELSDALTVTENGKVITDRHYRYEFDRTPCEAGNYVLKVYGRNDYGGSKDFPFTIGKAAIEKCKVTLEYKEAHFTGQELKPKVYVNPGVKLSDTRNYSVKYKNNIECGTADAVVTGNNSLTGQVTLTFQIGKCPISQAEVKVTSKPSVYSGKPHKPSVSVTIDGRKLKNNKDYAVSYSNNINASKNAVVRITGLGSYMGVKEQKFTILPKKLSGLKAVAKADTSEITLKHRKTIISPAYYDIEIFEGIEEKPAKIFEATKTYTVRGNLKGNYTGYFNIEKVKVRVDMDQLKLTFKNGRSVSYNGKALKPAVVLKDRHGNIIPPKSYKVKYANNKKVGTAKVTVTGKGLYTGTISATFKIVPGVITPSMIKPVKDRKYNGKAIQPKLKIKGLKRGRDFTCTYTNNKNVSYDKNGKVIKGAGIVIRPSSNYVFAKGFKGTYYFKIQPAPISSVKAKKGRYRGEGKAVYPSSLKVKAGKMVLKSSDYTVKYSGNTKVTRNAKVTVTAKKRSNYTGSKTVRFRIVR